jgi:putative Holliday junction resolvase
MARAWVEAFDTDLPVELVDERLSTVTATQARRASGRKLDKRVIDQAAAVALLQGFLDRT